ncbi:MAG: hypothetical protein H6739_18270 [Alphaproteobacteria bacterium]|nr:hypothetical protein [Alphaproteobacteria bacterium]
MRRFMTVLALAACTSLSCGDKEDDTSTSDTDTASGTPDCLCDDAGATLTAVSGCENFGGDEEQCSGWHSCLEENGEETNTPMPSGTELTCFGCTIRIECN